jgi:hypothetical protein
MNEQVDCARWGHPNADCLFAPTAQSVEGMQNEVRRRREEEVKEEYIV